MFVPTRTRCSIYQTMWAREGFIWRGIILPSPRRFPYVGSGKEYSMGRAIAATALNFFFPGAGYLLLGHKVPLAIAWLVGVIGLTYVEFGIQTAAPAYYLPMFVSVLIMNTAFAVDAWRVARP